MKIVVDAISARFGGLATYVEGVAGAWGSVAPEDELHVVLARGSPVSVTGSIAVREHRVALGRPLSVRSPFAQSLLVPRLVRELSADVVLSVIPIVPVGRLPVPLAVVVHDLRHELLPRQFPLSQRMLRKVAYTIAYTRAASLICVSRRTKEDLLRLHPGLREHRVKVAHHGADHVDAWARARPSEHAVAFGHTVNKRPELVVEAWRELTAAGLRPPPLHVVGLSAAGRAAIVASANRAGLSGTITARPFLPEGEFHRLLTGARLVIFPSDFEGFGLPVLEAMKLGIPVAVGPDAAVAEVAGGYAHTARDLGPVALADAVARALRAGVAEREAARRHADSYCWSQTVRSTRDYLVEALASRG